MSLLVLEITQVASHTIFLLNFLVDYLQLPATVTLSSERRNDEGKKERML